MASILKVNKLQHTNGTDALTVASDGNVNITGNLSATGSLGSLVLITKQSTTIYTTSASTHTVDFSNVPSDGTAKAFAVVGIVYAVSIVFLLE